MNLLKKFWPVVFIFIIWFIFSSPYFLKGKVPYSSTYQVNFFSPWSAYPQFAGAVKNNAMPDVIDQIYPWKHFTVQTFKQGQMPLWNPYSFSGTPQLANYQSAVLSPFNLLFFVLPFIDAWSILILLQPLLAGIFMYLFAKALKQSNFASTVSSVAFMFCGFLTTWMGYGTLGYAILFLPLSLFSIEKFYESKKLKYLFLLAVSIPLSFFAGHFQISVYFFAALALYIIFKFLKDKNKLNTFYIILYTIFGIFISLPQILPSIELYLQSLRSGIFQEIEVIPWGYISTFLAPDYLGNPVTRNDWFGHYAEWNAYIGLIPLILAFYSVLNKKFMRDIFFIVLAFLAFLMAFPTPFLGLIITLHVPVLSTSAAGRIIVLFSFSLSVLAGFGFDYLTADIGSKKFKKIIGVLAAFAVFFAVLWFVVLLKLFMPVDKIIIARQNLILPSIIFASFVFLTGLLILDRYFKIHKNFKLVVYCFIIIVIAFDLFRFASKWQAFDPKSLVFANVPTTQEFKKISGYERVLGSFGAEDAVYYKMPSVEGYDAVYIKSYGEFIASLNSGKLTESARSVVSLPYDGKYTAKAINLLGIKYIAHKISDGNNSWTFPVWKYPDLKLIYRDSAYQIFENPDAFPRAFLVDKYSVETNPQKILDAMFAGNFNLRNEVVLSENPGIKPVNNFQGNAEILQYTPDRVIIKTQGNANSLLFLSDTYYPGWNVYIDGKQSKIYLADYTFRAVALPKGNHTVEFIYEPLSFKIGILLSGIGVLLGIGIGFLLKRKKRLLF